MQHHSYDHNAAGWTGYIEGDGWVLFVADDGGTYLHREGAS